MRNDNYGLRLIQKYQPTAQPSDSDLMGAEFQVEGYSLSWPKMNEEERNKMREAHFFRDPSKDSWVYVPDMRDPVPDEPAKVKKKVVKKDSESP